MLSLLSRKVLPVLVSKSVSGESLSESLVKWSEVVQSCPALWDPMDCSLPGSSLHGILQARVLEWVAISSSRELPNSGIKPGSFAFQADALTLGSSKGEIFGFMPASRGGAFGAARAGLDGKFWNILYCSNWAFCKVLSSNLYSCNKCSACCQISGGG